MQTTRPLILALTLTLWPLLSGANGLPTEPAPTSTLPAYSGTQNSHNTADSRSDAAARATAGAAALAGSTSTAAGGTAAGGSATGGAGGQGGTSSAAGGSVGDASSGASITDNTSSAYKALAIGLPPPSAPAPLPRAQDCIGTSAWTAAGGWSFASGGRSEQAVLRECFLAQQIVVLRAACQFDAANQLQARLVQDMSGLQIQPAADVNLTDAQCRERSAPPAPIVFAPPAAGPVVAPAVAPTAPSAPAAPAPAPVAVAPIATAPSKVVPRKAPASKPAAKSSAKASVCDGAKS